MGNVITDSIKKLFDGFRTPNGRDNNNMPVMGTGVRNDEDRREGESNEQWGKRICGIVTGTLTALRAYLQRAYYFLYNRQVENVQLQEQARINTQMQIDSKNSEIRLITSQVDEANTRVNSLTRRIDDLRTEQREIRNGNERVNREQRLKLIISLVILIPLSVYLFLFYSSTIYAAFIRSSETLTGVANAMFDGNALSNAYSEGIWIFAICIFAPAIFFALGFALHFFSEQKAYLKLVAILLITFAFDCILAYMIGKRLHEYGIIIGEPMDEVYSISMAIRDVNSWAVIFCGFIVYVLWGIVFDICMNAYNGLDLNRTRLADIDRIINDCQDRIQNERNTINDLTQQRGRIEDDVRRLMTRLGNEAYIDYSSIRQEMTEFFSGWITMMQVLQINEDTQNQARGIFDNEILSLIPQNKNH